MSWETSTLWKVFQIHDISGTTLVDKDPGHHEVCNDDGDDHEVVLVDEVDTLEVLIRESDRRETLL